MARSVFVGLSLTVSAAACGGSAFAQSPDYDPQQGAPTRYQAPHDGFFKGKFWTDTRYRYEYVDQANLTKDARASTLRNKTGVESGFFHGFRAGVEGEFVVELGPDDFNNTINGRTQYPIVVDVESAEVDQAYLESQSIPGVALLGGRFLENLDNLRYVGSVAWRQNDQTFDGAKATVTAIPGVTLLYAYIGNVNRIFSDSSPVGNIHSNVHLMHAESKELSIGKLTAYAYLMDLYDLDPLSNASYGGFLKGKQKLNDSLTYHYRLEYAQQTSYGDAPIDYDADYVRVEQGLSKGGFTATAVYELLGSDGGSAAFQTPLATGHIFNGFADVFLVTPPTGLQDFYVEAKYKMPQGSSGPLSAFGGLLLVAQYHEFRSAVQDLDYGSEFDFYAYLPLRDGFYAEAKYANYQADAFFTDIQKVIFGLGYQY
ncbi:MAG: hypothetical protein ACSLE4_11890 [Methyloceanibacter sp.]|uniref:hypothetical protein n=1 Tax=Methyloceanibacter sp. TaxID=1965321 RepID=UPI003EDF1F82